MENNNKIYTLFAGVNGPGKRLFTAQWDLMKMKIE